MEHKIKELEQQIQTLWLAISNLQERIEDIKPLAVFLREKEELEELEDDLRDG